MSAGEMILSPPRLPYHPAITERFGYDKSAWKALVEAIFPNATDSNSVVLALSYCKARNLDPFKRNVHIVPIWNKELGRMVDTIWPGIGELRTTAFRTGEYAGNMPPQYGPDVSMTWPATEGKNSRGEVRVVFPEWCQITVKRFVKGVLCEFHGPPVYWLETYATASRWDDAPNTMWADRPRGMLMKCAEAAALRAAFPEEIGSDYTADEVQHAPVRTTIDVPSQDSGKSKVDRISEAIRKKPEPTPEPTPEPMETTDQLEIVHPGDSVEPPADAPTESQVKAFDKQLLAIKSAKSLQSINGIRPLIDAAEKSGKVTHSQAMQLLDAADGRAAELEGA